MAVFSFLLPLSLVVLAGGSNCFVLGGHRGGFFERRRPHRLMPLWLSRKARSTTHIISMDMTDGDTSKQRPNDDDDDDDDNDSVYLKSLGRRERKKELIRREHERRKNAWLARYGSAAALRQTFGNNNNNNNDRTLSPSQTRALYHALLPRSLLALSELGVLDPSDLAPLAYQARIAAKEYARSRCSLSGRVLTALVDQYRSVKNGNGLILPFSLFGSSRSKNVSMTWEDVWEKYEAKIMEEERTKAVGVNEKAAGRDHDENSNNLPNNVNEEDLMMRIYMRILEKSCATNAAFDGLFLKEDKNGDEDDDPLAAISSQLEKDIHSILLSPKEADKVMKRRDKIEKRKSKALEKEETQRVKVLEKEDKLKRKLERRRRKQQQVSMMIDD
ncbi:hypothetical protein ACHAXR_002613 [Thalassiosira sp. AJA248-18]